MPKAEVFPLPVHSGDIHKVVEHTHARGVKSFEDWYYTDPRIHSVSKYKRKFQEAFENCSSVAGPATIEGDVRSLVETLAAVGRSGGGEIPKGLR